MQKSKGTQLTKTQLYEAVKTLVEAESKHIQLPQHKLYTLVSIGFQYMLYMSTKKPGYYIIRAEDHYVLDKVIKKAKDPTTKKFLDKIAQSRRLKYGQSTFYLDYFQMSTWSQTNDLQKDRIKGALVIKNASPTPFADSPYRQEIQELRGEGMDINDHHYLTTLQEFCEKTISIVFEEELPNTTQVNFPFIKKDNNRTLSGVKISNDVQLETDS